MIKHLYGVYAADSSRWSRSSCSLSAAWVIGLLTRLSSSLSWKWCWSWRLWAHRWLPSTSSCPCSSWATFPARCCTGSSHPPLSATSPVSPSPSESRPHWISTISLEWVSGYLMCIFIFLSTVWPNPASPCIVQTQWEKLLVMSVWGLVLTLLQGQSARTLFLLRWTLH